jgi:valyl-tRNA synthetase
MNALPRGEKALAIVLAEGEVVLPWADMVDVEAEKVRLTNEIAILEREIVRLEGRLKDEAFITKAPAQVVDKERSKAASYQDKLKRLNQELAQLRRRSVRYSIFILRSM